MDIKKYLPAILGAIVAIVVIILAVVNFTGSDQSFDNLSSGVTQLQASSAMAENSAIESKDYEACVAATSVGAVVGGVNQSILSAKDGVCHFPDVTVDVNKCILLKIGGTEPVLDVTGESEPIVVSPGVSATETVEVSDTDAQVVTPVVVPLTPASAIVDMAFAPVFSLLKAAVSGSDLTPQAKAWIGATTTWVESSHQSVVALVADPGTGKLVLHGVDVDPATCTVKVAAPAVIDPASTAPVITSTISPEIAPASEHPPIL